MNATLQTFGLLVTAQLVVVMVPGPNTALILHTAARGRAAGFLVAFGIWPVGLLFACAGLYGLGGLFAAAPQVALVMRVICGLYLGWIGIKMVRASFRLGAPQSPAIVSGHALALWQGFITNFTNPKAIGYYASVFAATGAFDLPFWAQAIAVFLLPGIGLSWNVLLVLFASSPLVRGTITRAAKWIDRCAGAIMIGFGLKLLAQK